MTNPSLVIFETDNLRPKWHAHKRFCAIGTIQSNNRQLCRPDIGLLQKKQTPISQIPSSTNQLPALRGLFLFFVPPVLLSKKCPT